MTGDAAEAEAAVKWMEAQLYEHAASSRSEDEILAGRGTWMAMVSLKDDHPPCCNCTTVGEAEMMSPYAEDMQPLPSPPHDRVFT